MRLLLDLDYFGIAIAIGFGSLRIQFIMTLPLDLDYDGIAIAIGIAYDYRSICRIDCFVY
jgi:hypothetical protein